MGMIDFNNKEELIQKYKTNTMFKSGVIVVFLLIAYIFPGGFFNLLFGLGGLGLGYLAYNDHVDKVD